MPLLLWKALITHRTWQAVCKEIMEVFALGCQEDSVYGPCACGHTDRQKKQQLTQTHGRLAAIALTPKLYYCAASLAGVVTCPAVA